MDQYLLPATKYEAPARQVRKTTLNTIIEDEHTDNERRYQGRLGLRTEPRGRSRYLNTTRSNPSASPVPSLTYSHSSSHRSQVRSQDFDDLYDVSDDESIPSQGQDAAVYLQTGSSRSVSPDGFVYSEGDGKRCPSLVIPSPSYWPTLQKLQNSSPMPPPKVPISPGALSLLPHDQSTSSHPPSLDGSLISDPLARSTAPSTPDLRTLPTCVRIDGNTEKASDYFGLHIPTDDPEDFYLADGTHFTESTQTQEQPSNGLPTPDSPVLGSEAGDAEAGVQLPDGALAALQQLTLEIPQTPRIPQYSPDRTEMEQVHVNRSHRNSVDSVAMSSTSDYSLAQLSIPSPGGFFSSLEDTAQKTWRLPQASTVPSSATAEQFYGRPWQADIVEQIVEVADEGTEGILTAKQPVTAIRIEEPEPQIQEILDAQLSTPPKDGFDDDYAKTIRESAEHSLDRTSLWLANQTSYMAALRETNPVNDTSFSSDAATLVDTQHSRESSLTSPMKKVVRFLEEEAKEAPALETSESNSLYYHAFQHTANNCCKDDAFVHRKSRADAIQAGRVGMPKQHIDRLKATFEVASTSRIAPLRPISMFPGKKDQPEQTEEQKLLAIVEQERQALQQIKPSTWAVEAGKKLNGGHLFMSPAASTLLKLPACPASGQSHILDLAGEINCDWAWHVARAYPTSKVHTISTTTPTSDNLRGPRNCIRKVVDSLYCLPYPDNYFTVISARNLFAHLRTRPPPGSNTSLSEYDICLAECHRVLRPGGYLEFSMLDSDILHAGPRATALSVEFGFNLKTRGYDPTPTKDFLPRVHRAGFHSLKRAWIFHPMGSPSSAHVASSGREMQESSPPDVSALEAHLPSLEAVHGEVGSTADVASLTNLVGSWEWEKWLLKLQMEMGKDNEEFWEGVATVMEEGKRGGAGWRCLKGWARK